jgi:hypothetical protein
MEDQQIPPATNQPENFFSISFDEATRVQIKQAALWAKVITLCAFAGYAVALVVAIFGQTAYQTDYSSYSSNGEVMGGYVRTGNMVGVIITIALGVFINYFLYRFAVATAKGMDNMDSVKTNEGFNNLRRYFKIYGILIIIVLCFAVLGLLLALVVGLGRS